jgi:chromosome segregation ATPase
MPSDFEVKVGKNYDAAKTLQDSLAKIATGVKTHASNYDNACKMYFGNEDEIADIKKGIKDEQAKGAKASATTVTKLQGDLKKWEGLLPHQATKVKQEYAECQKLRAGVEQADKAQQTILATHKTLQSGAARAAMTNVTDTQKDLKDTGEMLTKAEKEITRLDTALKNCTPYPKTIK